MQRLRRWVEVAGIVALSLVALAIGAIVMFWLQSLVFG